MDEERSYGEFWNKDEGGASRFKSSPLDPNTQEMNVYNDCNVTQKDEGERAWSQAGRPHLVRCGSRLLECSSSGFLFSGIWVLWSKKGKKSMGEKKRDTKPRIRPV